MSIHRATLFQLALATKKHVIVEKENCFIYRIKTGMQTDSS